MNQKAYATEEVFEAIDIAKSQPVFHTYVNYNVMELCQYKDLAEIINTNVYQALPLYSSLQIAMQIIAAINAMHSEGYAHNDIKPSNVFIDNECKLKVGDLGLATKVNNKKLTYCGTPGFVAPEIDRFSAGKDQRKCDIFSLGVTLFQVITGGKIPF